MFLSTPHRAGFVAGLLASTGLVGLIYLAHALVALPFIPYDLADLVIRLTPGAIATQGIETLGSVAKLLVKLSAIAGIILFGGGLGALVGRYASRTNGITGVGARNVAVFLLFVVLLGLALLNHRSSQPNPLQPIPFLTLILLLLGWGAAPSFLIERLKPVAEASAEPESSERRVFLIRSGTAAIALAVGSTALAELLDGDAVAGEQPAATLPPAPNFSPERHVDVSQFNAPAAVRPRITSQSDLYYVSSRTRDPRVDSATYELIIDGNVERPQALTLDDLYRMPRIEQTSTLECISNEVGGELIGNCRWHGIRLSDLLDQTGIGEGSIKVVLHGADGYVDSISIEDALRPTTLVVLGVDGEPLTVPHGYPVRIIVPNIFGMKNVKWLERIEVVTHDFKGYWQERGWSDPAIVQTTSVIDTPRVVTLENGVVLLGGIAFAGSRGIQQVEVKINNDSWVAAEMEPETTPLQWRRWRYDWPAAPGTHQVAVRAVDGDGTLQTDQVALPHPDGATGYHSLRLAVS